MPAVDLEAYVARSGGLDLSAFAWADVPHHPVSPEAIRTLRYMQDVESHTIIYLRWGAINELTTLMGYRRLAKLAGHPMLSELLERIMLDESRHFFFYYRQAEERLQRPGAARVARLIVDRCWAPVGSGEQAKEELRFLAGYLFSGDEGRAAARKIDGTIRRLPGFETVRLVEAWIDSFADSRPRLRGGLRRNGNDDC